MGLISDLSNSFQQTVGNNAQPAGEPVQAVDPALEPVPDQTEIPVTPINDIGSETGTGTDLLAGSGSGSGSGSEVIQHVITPEELTTQYLLGENDRLREIYKQLTNHDVQKTIQHTEHQQKKINSYMTINYVLFVLFYIACIVFAFMFFYMTKNETILGMSIYKKVGIFLLVITYPFWVSLLDQIVMFVLRYLYALALGVPYIKGIKQ